VSRVDDTASIRIWLRDRIPSDIRACLGLPDAEHEGAEIIVFVAHVSQDVVGGPEYSRCAGPTGIEGWMGEGVSGLFGTNAVRAVQHPDGNGVLIVGTAV